MKILLIASKSGLCMGILDWLIESNKDKVITSHSCLQSRKIIENDVDIDLIIFDDEIADESGMEFLNWIKRNQKLRIIPIIIAGTNLTEESVTKFLQIGIDDILILPNSKATINAKISRFEQQGRPTILLVDDEPAILDILKEYLNQNRYISLKATSAEEALELLGENRVDAVITDIMLPKMDGIELMGKIKEKNPNMPVIIITGFSGRHTPQDVISMGADGFFSKPFNNIELSYKLRLILSHSNRNTQIFSKYI